jgi:hypothetical protein
MNDINYKFFKENVICTGSTDCGEERYKFYGPLQFGREYSMQVWSIEKTESPVPIEPIVNISTGLEETPIGSAPSQRSLLLRSSDYELSKDKQKLDIQFLHERDRRYVPIRKPDKTNESNEKDGSISTHYIPIKKKEPRFSNEGFVTLINNKPRKRNQDSIQEITQNPIHQDQSFQDRDDQNELDEDKHERFLGVHSEGPNRDKKTPSLEPHRIQFIPPATEQLDSSFPLFPKSQTSRDFTKTDIDFSAKWQFNLYKNGVFVEPKSDTSLSDFEWTHYKNSWQEQIFTTRQITNILGNLHKRLNTEQVQVR